MDIIRMVVMNRSVGYISSIIQRTARKAYNIAIAYILSLNQFHDKCPFLLGVDENSMVSKGITMVYRITMNTKYATNK